MDEFDLDALIEQIESGLIKQRDHVLHNPPTHALAERMTAHRVPSLSIAVIYQGRIIWAKAYGVQDTVSNNIAHIETRYQAGSISKPVAALAILRLCEQGKLDLDADINDYLKSWKVPTVNGWQPKITLRHLLSHTAGMTVHGFLGYNHTESVPTTAQILNGEAPANNDPVHVDTLPGTQFRYAGGGTTIAQLAAMDVTNQAFNDIVQELVFDPIGMAHSAYDQPLSDQLHDVAAHAYLYTGHAVDGRWYTMPELAAAGLWTTPTDIAKFAIAVYQAKQGKHPTISQQVVEWMLTPVIESVERDAHVGLGVFLRGEGESLNFGHGGANVGYKNDFVMYANQGYGAVMMSPADNGYNLILEMRAAVAKAFEWVDYFKDSPQPSENAPKILAPFVGDYQLRDDFTLDIKQKDNQLIVTMTGQPEPLPLNAMMNDVFQVGDLKTWLAFKRDESGNITEMIVKQNGQELPAKRID